MPILGIAGIVLLLLLVGWRRMGARARLWVRRRGGLPVPAGRPSEPLRTTMPAPDTTDGPVAEIESVSLALPIHGLPPGRDGASTLERMLQNLGGVTRVFVSPVTAFAYVDYLAAQLTEAELVQAIADDGYRVGDVAHRFDWRHRTRAPGSS